MVLMDDLPPKLKESFRDKYKEMVDRMVEKVSRMRPIPSNKDMSDASWEKVDVLVKKALVFMVQNKQERSLQLLMSELVERSFNDLFGAESLDELNPGLQALAGRCLDSWLLTYESRRFSAILRGKEPFSVPEHPWDTPIVYGEHELYRVGTKTALLMINTELRKRKLVEPRDKEN